MPALFTALGAGLGLAAGWVKESVDDRRAKKAFLKAIRVELLEMHRHMAGTLREASDVLEAIDAGFPQALHLGAAFQTGIYTCQIARLRQVFDPIVIEVIQFYDRLANIERIKSHLMAASLELVTEAKEKIRVDDARAVHYRNTLREVIRRLEQMLPAAEELIRKLPQY